MKIFIKLCLPIGLLIFVIYQILKHLIIIPDVVAVPTCIIIIILLMIGVAYNSWCLGKNKNPYDFSSDKK